MEEMLMSAGLSLREMLHEFKHQTLVLFKCLLLQPKVSQDLFKKTINSLTRIDALLRLSM